MPTLSFIVVCRQALVDRDSGLLSLIGLFDTVEFAVPDATRLPEDALMPYEWAAVTEWTPGAGDDEGDYDVRCETVVPDGRTVGQIVSVVRMGSARQRVVQRAPGMPIGTPGVHRLRVAWRKTDSDVPWETAGEYEFVVKVVQGPAGPPDSESAPAAAA